MRLLLLCGFALGLAILTPSGRAAHRAGGTLHGTVGPAFTIVLVDASGARVTHLDPGSYTIQVDDLSPGHNFHLFGPGVDLATDVLGTGTVTWNVTFTDGAYAFVCDPHVGEMSGGFMVGSSTSTNTSGGSGAASAASSRTTTPSPAVQPATPAANESAAPADRRVSTAPLAVVRAMLTPSAIAIAPTSLKAGTYALIVRDRSRTRGFWIAGDGVTRRTTRPRVGTIRWQINLAPGRYTYGANGRVVGTLRVSR
jgi:hypothetical protein